MPEMQLKQPGFTYSACGHLPETKKKLKNLCRQEIEILFTEMSMLWTWFCLWQIKSKDLAKKTQSDKVLRDKAFKIASDPKYDGYQRGLASMVYKFFDKKSSGSGVDAEPHYQLENELHREIIRKFKRRKVYSFLEAIFGVFI